MDYNDNDFAPQNSQLVGDEESKFPLGLHSYALPKFDIDEHLQVHLRYDSLGETGILLDIPSETEDRWIEDYSREDSNILLLDPVSQGIGFGVSAEESCTISRNNNVWSEAASSESVEMLLNSVGQDEMTTDKRDVARSDASDTLDKVSKQMSSEFCQDDSPCNAKKDSSTDSIVPPDNSQGDSPSFEKDASEDILHVKSMLDLQASNVLLTNNFHENETGKPGSSSERISVEVKSSHGTEAELVPSYKECSDEVVHMKGLETSQEEKVFTGDDSLHCKSVVIDELHSVSAFPDEVNSEKLVTMPKVSPTTQPDTVEVSFPIGNACNKVSSEGSQGTDFNANAANEEVSCKDSDMSYHLMDDEFVHKTDCILGEAHLTEEKSVVLINSTLVQKKPASSDMTEGTQDCLQSVDIGCTVVPKTSIQVGGEDMDSAILQREVSVELVDNSKMPPSKVQNCSEVIPSHGPVSSDIENQIGGVQSSGSGCDHASQSDDVSVHVDMGMHAPQDLPKKDSVQQKIVGLDSQTSQNVVGEILSCAGITVVLDQFDPGPIGVVSSNISDIAVSGGSEGSPCLMVVESNLMASEEHLQQKEETSVVLASGERDNREHVDGECQAVSSANLSSSKAGRSHDSNETELPTMVSGSLTGASAGKNQEGEATSSEETSSDHSAAVTLTNSAVDLKVTSEASKGEASIMSSEETPSECPQSITEETFSFVSSTTVALKNPIVDSKASSDAVKTVPVSYLVNASKRVDDVACGHDSLKNDVNSSKTGSDITNYAEPECGSPTIISCSEAFIGEGKYEEGTKDSSVPSPASGGVSCCPLDIPAHSDKQKGTERTLPGSDMEESDKSFTFEVGKVAGSIMDEMTAKGWKPFPSVQPVETFQTNPRGSEDESKVSQSPKEQDKIEVRKDQSRGKSRSRTGSGTGRVTTGKGKATKEPSSARSTSSTQRDGKNIATTSVSPARPLVSGSVQVKEIQKLVNVEGSATKTFSVAPAQLPNLSDFSALASPASANFQKPFTDMQQLQLRAQIFVYGSLMQGTAPDEACMISAFGESVRDAGRSTWESVWRVAVEQAQTQKSWASNPEISPLSFSGMRTNEQAAKGSAVHGKLPSTSACKTAANGSSVLNPAVHLSSPLWSMSTPSVARASHIDTNTTMTPVQLYPSPHGRPFGGHHSPWSSHASSPVPWVLSPQMPALDARLSYGTLSKQETGKAIPDQDQPVVVSAGVHSSSQPVASSPAVSSAVVPLSIHTDARTTSTAGRQSSADQKSRKRKKNMPPEGSQPLCVQSSPTKSGSPAVIPKNIPLCVPLIAPTTSPFSSVVSASKAAVGDPILPNPPVASSTECQTISGGNAVRSLVVSEETCSQIEHAKLQAEDASALASSAVRHSQEIWSQLAAQMNSGLAMDIEQKLASAAVAATAAASVAKAAAAAAKIASDAALQAKLMVDEILTMNRMVTVAQSMETANTAEGGKSFWEVIPASALKGKKQGISSSVIEFAKEAAKKRVEAASAAAKRAQNLDAVVKAAELAAEAVSQATVIVGMGDPIPLTLNELLEAGPESYWKHQETSSLYTMKTKTMLVALTSSKDSGELNSLHGKDLSKKDVTQCSNGRNEDVSKELSKQSVDNWTKPVTYTRIKVPTDGPIEIQQQKATRDSDSANTATSGSILPLEPKSRSVSIPVQSANHENHDERRTSTVNPMRQGSLVEVISQEEGLGAVWFSATVLEIKDGTAYVCYNDLLSEEGQRKEWILLGVSDGKPPRIRIPHPMTAMKFERTRKRRRSVMDNYNWSAGDHVDAWIRDGWREGIITEKSIEDETKLTVCFPVKGDTRTVRAWNIRPSLVWKDDQWVEWPRERDCWHNEGDAPLDKRQKVEGNLENDAPFNKGKENLSNAYSDGSMKPQEPMPLNLQPKDKIFSVGKSVEEDNKLAVGRVKRTGLQKEGSRVVFGVPKPGKKRKFMEVSKHYNAKPIGKVREVNSEPKFAKYLMPTRSSGLKGPSKGDLKGDRVTNIKSKDAKSVKPQGRQGRNRSEKVSSTSVLPASSGAVGVELPDVQPSVNHKGHPRRLNRMESSSSEVPKLTSVSGPLSSVEQSLDLSTQRNKTTTDHGQAPKGKIAPAGRKLSSDEEKTSAASAQGKPSDSVELRRSNRRIQPTSRLLEGIQSSLTTGKVSSIVLNEKGLKSSTKNR